MFLKRSLWLLVLLPGLGLASSWPDVPRPENMTVSDVSGHIVYNGADMRAQVFHARASVKDIVAFYRRRWGRRMVVNAMGNSKLIGHKQGDYFITVQVRGLAGGSEGKIGIMNLATVPKHITLGKGLPTPMGSVVINDIRYPDDPMPARTVTMGNDMSPRQNTAYFRERLEGQGWKPEATNRHCRGTKPCLMQYTRGDSKMTWMAIPGKHGGSQVVINMQQPGGFR
jgi:hypothetical protein